MESRNHCHRRINQCHPVRFCRTICSCFTTSLRLTPRNHERAHHHLEWRTPHHTDHPTVAPVFTVGRSCRNWLGLHGHSICFDCCISLVREAQRFGYRCAHCCIGKWTVGIPSTHVSTCRTLRLALCRRNHCVVRTCSYPCCVFLFAQLPCRHRPHSLRRTRRSRTTSSTAESHSLSVQCFSRCA